MMYQQWRNFVFFLTLSDCFVFFLIVCSLNGNCKKSKFQQKTGLRISSWRSFISLSFRWIIIIESFHNCFSKNLHGSITINSLGILFEISDILKLLVTYSELRVKLNFRIPVSQSGNIAQFIILNYLFARLRMFPWFGIFDVSIYHDEHLLLYDINQNRSMSIKGTGKVEDFYRGKWLERLWNSRGPTMEVAGERLEMRIQSGN